MCPFCDIVSRAAEAEIVYEDDHTLAFLDHRPLFAGHSLLIPKDHHATLADLPLDLIGPLFHAAQVLARAMEQALGAQGSFVAMNNTVSQSVPHLHVHVVPRTRKDGLRGFFWPRQSYESDEQMAAIADRLRATTLRLRAESDRLDDRVHRPEAGDEPAGERGVRKDAAAKGDRT